jgi:hypothetical protein
MGLAEKVKYAIAIVRGIKDRRLSKDAENRGLKLAEFVA